MSIYWSGGVTNSKYCRWFIRQPDDNNNNNNNTATLLYLVDDFTLSGLPNTIEKNQLQVVYTIIISYFA